MPTYVLVPGFWLGRWAWDEVARPLRVAGHEVLAVTPAADADATIESRVADLLVELSGRSDAVLVGHSGAGPVVAAAERARAHLARVVFASSRGAPARRASTP